MSSNEDEKRLSGNEQAPVPALDKPDNPAVAQLKGDVKKKAPNAEKKDGIHADLQAPSNSADKKASSKNKQAEHGDDSVGKDVGPAGERKSPLKDFPQPKAAPAAATQATSESEGSVIGEGAASGEDDSGAEGSAIEEGAASGEGDASGEATVSGDSAADREGAVNGEGAGCSAGGVKDDGEDGSKLPPRPNKEGKVTEGNNGASSDTSNDDPIEDYVKLAERITPEGIRANINKGKTDEGSGGKEMKNQEDADAKDRENSNKACNCDEADGNCVSCVEKKEAVSESSDDKSSCGGVSLSKYEGVSLSPSSSVGVLTKSDDSKAPLFSIGSNDNASESALSSAKETDETSSSSSISKEADDETEKEETGSKETDIVTDVREAALVGEPGDVGNNPEAECDRPRDADTESASGDDAVSEEGAVEGAVGAEDTSGEGATREGETSSEGAVSGEGAVGGEDDVSGEGAIEGEGFVGGEGATSGEGAEEAPSGEGAADSEGGVSGEVSGEVGGEEAAGCSTGGVGDGEDGSKPRPNKEEKVREGNNGSLTEDDFITDYSQITFKREDVLAANKEKQAGNSDEETELFHDAKSNMSVNSSMSNTKDDEGEDVTP